MKKNQLVSIIIPVYNAERFLDDTINMILDQSYKNWEMLLVDDCSNDNSKKIFNKYEKDNRIRWIEQRENVGPALTRNHGIDEAKGTYICFTDADDRWSYDKLEKQVAFMEKHRCAFSYHSYEFADNKCIPNGKKVAAKKKLDYKQALKNTVIFTSTVMLDQTMIDKDLMKMPNLKYVEDTATWWKILRNGYTAFGMPEVLAYYRRSAGTNSSNKFKTQKPLWNLYRQTEKLSFLYSLHCMFWKNSHALIRRI